MGPPVVRLVATLIRISIKFEGLVRKILLGILIGVINLVAKFAPIVAAGIEKTTGLIEKFLPVVEEGFDRIGGWVDNLVDEVIPVVQRFFSTAKGEIDKFFTALRKLKIDFEKVFSDIWGFIKGVYDRIVLGWKIAVATVKLLVLTLSGAFAEFGRDVLRLLEPVFEKTQQLIDAANKLGAGIDINLTGGVENIDEALAGVSARRETAAAELRELERGQAALTAQAVSSSTSIGQINVQVQGSTGMGEQELARSTGQGVNMALEKRRTAQDLQTG
jgi:phage-related protein